jgi:2-haloacid dehalogenase
MPNGLHAVVIDVLGTLFSLDPIEEQLTGLGFPPGATDLWFASLLRDSFALEIAGRFDGFQSVAQSALDALASRKRLMGRPLAREEQRAVWGAFQALPARPEAREALVTLREAGFSLATLSNSSVATCEKLLERAGLANLIDHVLSAESTGHAKPSPVAYDWAARRVRALPWAIVCLSAHSWDILGARRAGLLGAFVTRYEKTFPAALGHADVEGGDLLEAAAAIIDLRQKRQVPLEEPPPAPFT